MLSDVGENILNFRLFHDADRETLLRVKDKAVLKTVPGDTIIVAEGDRPGHLHIVREGLIELYACSSKNRTTIALLKPGDCFILSAIVHRAVALMSARSLGSSELLQVPAGLFRKALQSDRKLLLNVSMELGSEFRGLVRHLRDQKLRSADQRLVAYLVRLGIEQGNDHEVVLPLRKHLIASYLGIRSESLSRAFSDLQSLGVSVNGEHVRIADPAALVRFANIDKNIDSPDF